MHFSLLITSYFNIKKDDKINNKNNKKKDNKKIINNINAFKYL